MAAGVKSLSRTFVWILMGLLMLGLAGFGAVNLSGTARTVAIVGDQTVSVDAYARELQREIRAVEAQTGQTLPMQQVRALGIDQLALSRLISLASIDNEVASLGVSIGDENLQKEIITIPAFQGVDGSFDREGYRFALEQAGLSEPQFEDDLRRGISQNSGSGRHHWGRENACSHDRHDCQLCCGTSQFHSCDSFPGIAGCACGHTNRCTNPSLL